MGLTHILTRDHSIATVPSANCGLAVWPTLGLPIGPALLAPPTREKEQRTSRAFKENQQSYQQNDHLSIT